MARFILRYQGAGTKPQSDVKKFSGLSNVKLVDESAKMLLVEAPTQESLVDAVSDVEGWAICPECSIELPPPHPKLRKNKPSPGPESCS
jgi:hypothetical protein